MMGLDFTVRTADIDETMDPSQTPAHEVAAVSARKAAKIAAMHPDDVIVSADTIVVIDGKILGKPKDEEDAARMLRMLSGRTHTVYTGLTVHADGESKTQVVGTDVTFRELTDAEIAAYIETKEPMDKAGCLRHSGLRLDVCLAFGWRLFLRDGASGLYARRHAAQRGRGDFRADLMIWRLDFSAGK